MCLRVSVPLMVHKVSLQQLVLLCGFCVHFVCVGPENAAQKLLVFDLDGILCDRSLKKKAYRLLKTYRDFDEHPFVARSRPYLAALVKFLKVSQNCGFPHAMLPLFACLVTFCEVD